MLLILPVFIGLLLQSTRKLPVIILLKICMNFLQAVDPTLEKLFVIAVTIFFQVVADINTSLFQCFIEIEQIIVRHGLLRPAFLSSGDENYQ